MPCLRSNQALLCVSSLFIVFTYSAFGSSEDHRSLQIPDVFGEREFGGALLLGKTKRFLAEEQSSLILAQKRTQRRDPLDDFKVYNGGWNISNEHYWASVGFTAAPFFVIAVAWFVLFGISLSFICLCYCCCPREPYGYSRLCYALSLIFLILFTLAAIVGSLVLYTSQGKLHNSTTSTLEYVVDQADTTVENLRNVSDYLSASKKIGVNSVFLPKELQSRIDDIVGKINSSASTLSDKTGDNSQDIQNGLDNVRIALIILAAVMLFLAFLGFLVSILGMQCFVYFLVISGWILVAFTFILCGIFLLLHNVVTDTCVAMDEWVLNPTDHTALDDILPCVDNTTAQETLLESKNVTYQLVTVVNGVIASVANVNMPPIVGPPLNYNQSGPLMPILCNPFYSNLTDRKCAPSEVGLDVANKEWKNYTCEVSSSGICTTPGRITPTYYEQMASSVNVSYGLYHYSPFLVNLEDCTFARQTFMDISKKYCPGLRRYTKWIYAGLVLVSGAVMFSLIFWVIYARERRHRVYTKRFRGRDGEPGKAF